MVSSPVFNRSLALERWKSGCWRQRGGLFAAQFLVAPAWAEEVQASSFFGDIEVFVAIAVLLPVALIGTLAWRLHAARKAQLASQTLPMPPAPARTAATPPAPVPVRATPVQALVEEIDLIQQAEYLSLLGERDAAVTLLATHIDGAGDTEAPIWIKLMQIHRRFGDRQSFERLRPLYRQRFGDEAPPWARDQSDSIPPISQVSGAPVRMPADAGGRLPAPTGLLPTAGLVARERQSGEGARSPGA